MLFYEVYVNNGNGYKNVYCDKDKYMYAYVINILLSRGGIVKETKNGKFVSTTYIEL